MTISPRAPRRGAGLLAGLVLALLGVSVIVVAGIVGPIVTHALAAGIVAL
jgi:hypothetical protein